MATKAELEQEVETLRQQLAETNPDLAAINRELDALKTDLGKAVSERDFNWEKLQAALKDLDTEKAATAEAITQRDQTGVLLQKSSSDLGETLTKLDEEKEAHGETQGKLQNMTQATLDAHEKLSKLDPTKGVCEGEHVSLDGKKHGIIWRSTVKDIVFEGYHKRNLDENYTAIVIQKHGG